MNARPLLFLAPCTVLVFAGLGAGCTGFQHVAPGKSVLVAQARRPVVFATPTPTPSLSASSAPVFALNEVSPDLPRSEPLPPSSMADFFTLGNSYLQVGRNTEAVEAFKKATELDPTYAEAWHNLALSYESAGDEADAVQAFRRYKMIPSGQ